MSVNCGKRINNCIQGGFSMLEVLVAILVLSSGLLGMATLITVGMRGNNTAYFRSIAIQQTSDIADRIRANLAGARAGNYDALTAVIPVSSDCVVAHCNAAQMSIYDHAQWNTANSILLPGGMGTVTGTLATGFLVTLSWSEKEMGGVADPACPMGTQINTRCFLMRFSP